MGDDREREREVVDVDTKDKKEKGKLWGKSIHSLWPCWLGFYSCTQNAQMIHMSKLISVTDRQTALSCAYLEQGSDARTCRPNGVFVRPISHKLVT